MFGFARTMTINGCVISGLDPGAVPGGSTRALRARSQKTVVRTQKGFLASDFRILISGDEASRWGRNRIDRRVKADLSSGMVSAVIGLIVQVPTIMKWPSLPN